MHFKHHQIDKKKWDKCISSSKENIIYAFSWYLDQVSPKWEGFVLEDENNEYIAVMPLPTKKKYGISFLQVPLFAQQLGVFSIKKLSTFEFKAFLFLLQKRFKLISNYPFNTTNYEEFEIEFEEVFDKNTALKKHKTHHLSLNKEYSQIRQDYKKDTKYRINQAQKQNFEAVRKTQNDDIDLVFDFFEKNVSLKNGISSQAKQTLKTLFKILKERGLTELFYIKNNQNEIVSGVFFVKSEMFYQENNQNYCTTKWIYLFNAAKKKENQKDESRRWFLDKFIQEKRSLIIVNNFEKQSKSTTYETVLDFESAQEKSVVRFYESFGSKEKPFFVVDYNKLPFYTKAIQYLIRIIRQFISK